MITSILGKSLGTNHTYRLDDPNTGQQAIEMTGQDEILFAIFLRFLGLDWTTNIVCLIQSLNTRDGQ